MTDSFFRYERSPYLKSLQASSLEEISCPLCKDSNLRIGQYGDSDFPDYHITCDSCEFTCPAGSADYGEAKYEFERWAEAFHLLGNPIEYFRDPYLVFRMYKEGESRNIAIKRYTGDTND